MRSIAVIQANHTDLLPGDSGSALLAQRCAKVTGADLSAESMIDAQKQHRLANLDFDVQDGCNMTYLDGSFSAVVCMNTLEHVPDDGSFLENCHRVRGNGGRLIVEAPLLRRRPFNFPLISSHLREYDKQVLVNMISHHGFEIEQLFGMNRGQYVDGEMTRESILIVAHRSERLGKER